MRWSFSIFLLALVLSGCIATPKNITIGLPFTLTGKWGPLGVQSLNVAKMYQKFVNKAGGIEIGGEKYLIDLLAKDVGESEALTKETVEKMMNGSYGIVPDLFIAPYSSTLTPVAALVAEKNKKVMMASGSAAESVYMCDESALEPCKGDTGRRFDYLYGTLTPAGHYFRPGVWLSKIKQAKTIAIFSEEEAFTEATVAGVKLAAYENGMEVVFERTIKKVATETPEAVREMQELLGNITAAAPDVVFGGTYHPACVLAAEQWFALDLPLPKALSMTVCTELAVKEALGDKIAYVLGPAQWDPRLEGMFYVEDKNSPFSMYPSLDKNDTPSAMQFALDYKAQYGEDPYYQTASTLAALYALHMGYLSANSTDTELLRQQLGLLYEFSFYGIISFDRWGRNVQKEMVTVQYDKNLTLQVVTPLSSASEEVIWPMPQWWERVFVPEYFHTVLEKLVIGLCSVAGFIILTLIVFVAAHWKSRPINHASPAFCLMILSGALGLVFAPLSWPVNASQFTCTVRMWIWPQSFGLFFAPLFAKNYRIYRLFSNQKLRQVKFSDKKLSSITFSLCLPLLALTTFWAILDPLTSRVNIPDPLRPSLNEVVCVNDSEMWAFWCLIYASLMLCVGAAVALLQMRAFARMSGTSAVLGNFNESRPVGFAVFNLLFTGFLICVVLVSGFDDVQTLFLIRSVGVIAVVLLCVLMIFIPKVSAVRDEKRGIATLYGSQGGSIQMGSNASVRVEVKNPVLERKENI